MILPSLPSVLWRCWLGGRKGIWPVKKQSGGVLAWLSVWSKVKTWIWPSWCHCHSLSLASLKSGLVLPFWYWLTWVVLEKGPLNGCVCMYTISVLVVVFKMEPDLVGLPRFYFPTFSSEREPLGLSTGFSKLYAFDVTQQTYHITKGNWKHWWQPR